MRSSKVLILSITAAVAITAVVVVFLIVRRKNKVKNIIADMNTNEKTAKGLVKYALSQVGRPYWYGTNGQTATQALFDQKKALYPDQYNKPMYNDAPTQYGQRVHDCAGLIEAYMWSVDGSKDGLIIPNSNNFPDTTADNMYAQATEKGDINTMPEIAGLILHKKGHVGVYIGNGKVAEAAGHKSGVIVSDRDKVNWLHWFKLKGLKYE